MSVIATVIEPHRVTRVIFDAHDLAVGDQQRIAQAMNVLSPRLMTTR